MTEKESILKSIVSDLVSNFKSPLFSLIIYAARVKYNFTLTDDDIYDYFVEILYESGLYEDNNIAKVDDANSINISQNTESLEFPEGDDSDDVEVFFQENAEQNDDYDENKKEDEDSNHDNFTYNSNIDNREYFREVTTNGGFVLFGKNYRADKQITLMCLLLRELQKMWPDFYEKLYLAHDDRECLERLRKMKKGVREINWERKFLSKDIKEIYPGNEKLQSERSAAKYLGDGWYLMANCNKYRKKDLLFLICATCNIKLGVDLIINWPN